MRNRSSLMTVVIACLTLVVAGVLSVTPSGCSVNEQFARTASPLATDITGDIIQYADASDTATKDAATKFLQAVNAGDKPQTVASWYGDGTKDNAGVRAAYVHWLASAPLFEKSGGDKLRDIKYRNVVAFAYVLSIGNNPAT